jgi:predicted dehydrogenase
MKCLVIGYGSIGKRHIENLSLISNIELIVITKRKTDNFLHTKKCIVLEKIQEGINQKPDFAIISNPSSYHLKTAQKLVDNGIDLFIEKPLSNSIIGLDSLLKKIQKKKLITMIGCNLRFHPSIVKIKELIIKKKIGKPLVVKVENGSYLPSWHPNEKYQKSYASRKELGGGVVFTLIHEMDYLYWFFGMSNEVTAISEKVSELDISVEDLATMILRFKNNVIAELHLDFFQKPSSRTCKIIGTKGTIFWDIKTNNVKVFDNKKDKWVTELNLQKYDSNEMYILELKHFIKCVKERKKSLNDIYEGINVIKMAVAAKKSSNTKRTVKIS